MILLKVADISNEVRPLEVAEPWIECLLEEFFQQVGEIFNRNICKGHIMQTCRRNILTITVTVITAVTR